ncbi:MAG: FAD binding domain-containing protein [Myxococcales bacterium]|nr:FAD binding domain-containing protein [Myxococcales bacterium]USN50188.1 MAG: FAD binding domain-containing protein [Myxococcales bacterium]
MLPLSSFRVESPSNMAQLADCIKKASQKIKIMSGGTDLIPNLKHRLYDIEHIISLQNIQELDGVKFENGKIYIGANLKLCEVISNDVLENYCPALKEAASHIASPQIRNMATVGGNICLDTRCLYFNQSEFWRSALGYCLKKDGTVCHVIKTGKRCVAASSNDLVSVLLALKARLCIWSPGHEYEIDLDDFYTANGLKNNKLGDGEIVSKVYFEAVKNKCTGFAKLRHRQSIDFSLISVGVSYMLEHERVRDLTVVVNALVAKPKVLVFPQLEHTTLDNRLINEVALQSAQKCHPQSNICDDPKWRKEMVKIYVERAFENSLKNRK